jgi:hypothetical protein
MLMSFTEPLSVVIGGVTTPLPRVDTPDGGTAYRSADGLIVVRASHDYGKRVRRMLRIECSKMSPDVHVADTLVERSMSLYTVFDLPVAGYDNAQALAVWTGYKTLVTASSDLMLVKLLGGES